MQGRKSEGYSGVQEKDDLALEWDGDTEDGVMWIDSRHILELEWLGPSDEVNMGDEGEGVIKDNCEVFSLNH